MELFLGEVVIIHYTGSRFTNFAYRSNGRLRWS